jgi:shikimate kinase
MTAFRRVYITGFMGCGKTTAGRELASVLNFSFMDLDDQIERREQKPVSEIFEKLGEDYFRKVESETLNTLNISAHTVISTGGGTPCFGNNLTYMKETGVLVYLKMTPLQLSRRLGGMTGKRPLLKGLAKDELEKYIAGKLKEREPFYNQSALVIDGLNPDIRLLGEAIMNLFV